MSTMNKIRNRVPCLLLPLLLLTAGRLAAQQQAAKTLTLKDCIQIALDKSTAVLKGNNNVALAGAHVLAAYGQYLPNLAAGAGYNYNHGNNFFAATGPTVVNLSRSQFNYQLTSSLNLFTGYYNYATWKAARINEQVADYTLLRAKQQITLDVTQAYLQIVLDKKLVALDSANLATSLKREDQLLTLTEIGRKAKTDLYQQQAQTSNDKLLLINAKSKLQNDKVLLLQKLRINAADLYEFADMTIADNADVAKYGNKDALVNEALKNRPDIKSALLDVQSSDWNIKKSRSGYLPTVSLSAGLYNNGAYFNSLAVNGNEQQIATQQNIPTQLYKYTYGIAGINAVWNIFDRYYTKSTVAVAKINADNARITADDTRIGVNADVQQAYNDYTNALQQMETVQSGLTAAQKAYEAVDARYKEGATDFITTSNAQLVLLQAEQNKIQASVNMLLQKRIIDFYVGVNN